MNKISHPRIQTPQTTECGTRESSASLCFILTGAAERDISYCREMLINYIF